MGRNKASADTVPILIIILVLFTVGLLGHSYDRSLHQKELYAGSLLFSMGYLPLFCRSVI